MFKVIVFNRRTNFTVLFMLLFILSVFNCKQAGSKEMVESITEASTVNLIEAPSEENSALPRLFSNGTALYMSWVAKEDSLSTLFYSKYSNNKWSQPEAIISGTDWFVNWADFPVIAENNGNILTSFLQKSASGTYTYDVKLNLYRAKTGSWKKNFILHTDGTQSEHGFVTIKPYVGNSFFVTWLDGRETAGKAHGGGQMTLRGAIVFEDGTIDYDTLLDERVCDCCQTTAAIGANEELIVAYRDRSENEIRDISVVRWEKETGWSAPMTPGQDHWKIAGCPVNGPAMDIDGNHLALAWFTAAGGEGKVQLMFSDDAGKTFTKPFRIDAGNATGRVDVVMLGPKEAAVVWMEPDGDEEVIRLLKIDSDGMTGRPVTVSKTSAERASGFPQLEKAGEELFLSWTETGESGTNIKIAAIPLSNLR